MTQVSINIFLGGESPAVRRYPRAEDVGTPFAVIDLGGVEIFVWQPREAEALIAALQETALWLRTQEPLVLPGLLAAEVH